MTIERRITELERRGGPGLLSLAASLLAARGRPLAPASEAPSPIIRAARERVERMRGLEHYQD